MRVFIDSRKGLYKWQLFADVYLKKGLDFDPKGAKFKEKVEILKSLPIEIDGIIYNINEYNGSVVGHDVGS